MSFAHTTDVRIPRAQVRAYARRALGYGGVPYENNLLTEIALSGVNTTTTLFRLVPDFGMVDHENRADEAAYLSAYGHTHTVFTLRPIGRYGDVRHFCCFSAARRNGRSDFTQEELDLVTTFTAQSTSFVSVPNRQHHYKVFAAFTPAVRASVAIYCSCGDMDYAAHLLGLAADTVRDNVKSAARRLTGSSKLKPFRDMLEGDRRSDPPSGKSAT